MAATPLAAPDASLATAYPEVARLRAALDNEDWPAVQALFADIGWDGYSLLTFAAGAWQPGYGFLSGRASEDQAEPLAVVLFASQLVHTGWRARSAAPAAQVNDQQFAVFRDHLRRAEQLLEPFTDRHPDHVVAWELRLITARGLELGLDEARRRYEQIARIAPHHLPAQRQLLQQLAPKWGGSFAQLHEFARECAQSAPDGAPNGSLVAEAHLEHWLALPGGDDAAYLRDPGVWGELRQAAARSVWHPDYRRTYGWAAVHNLFAMMFSLVDDREAAASQFVEIGHLADDCWAYLAEPAASFQRHRQQALTGPASPPRAPAAPSVPRQAGATSAGAAAAAAVAPGGGNLAAIVTLAVLAATLLLCGGFAALGAVDDPEFGSDGWAGVGVILAAAVVLGVIAWRMRRRRQARQAWQAVREGPAGPAATTGPAGQTGAAGTTRHTGQAEES